jgi:hypothetical protein
MTRRYRVDFTHDVMQDSFQIQRALIEHGGHELADRWEEGLNKAFLHLSKNPFTQIQERESDLLQMPIHRYLYCMSKSSKSGYHLYYSLEVFPVPNPEPMMDYLAGVVKILWISSASGAGFSDEEMLKR